MPFRQSTLNFGFKAATTSLTALPTIPSAIDLVSSSSSFTTEVDTDTIVVDVSEANPQLPTPAESATDVSSQDGHAESIRILPKTRSKRVSTTRKSRFREASSDPAVPEADEQGRNISGKTLVDDTTKDSLLENGIKALNLPWTVNELASSTNDHADDETEVGSTVILNPADEENETERALKAAARKVKKEENAKKWEQRKKAAENNAVRKSNRSSMLAKASDIVSEVSGVLGKRSRGLVEKSMDKLADLKSSMGSKSSKAAAEEPSSKKARFTQDTLISGTPAPRRTVNRRGKKWLISGLYAGQRRAFDARLTESGNKRKSTAASAEQSKDNSVLPLPMFAGERLLKHGRDFKLPFDVFGPPPPGQAKPDGWKKCNKNVFVGDAADVWRANKNVEHSTCYCRPETGCDQNCMNRYMYYECDDNNCNLSYHQCGNRQWEELRRRTKCGSSYSVGVDVIKTTDRGHGVRASRTFESNQLIVEYAGEIITQEECEHRMRTIYKDNECYYLMLFDQNMILDATRGSVARFVNHSCEPNCRMEKWTVDGKPRMALFAGENGIMTGEELTYDYNFDPYSQKNVQICRCGSEKCRGVLGPKPKEVKQKSPDEEAHGRKSEGRLTGAKRKMAEVLEESANQLTKKRKMSGPTKLAKKPASKSKQGKVSPLKRKLVAVKVKKTARKVSIPRTTGRAPAKPPAKLKKALTAAKSKPKAAKGRRNVSQSSATEALLSTKAKKAPSPAKKSLSRSSSLKDKASSLKRSIISSVRGRGTKATTITVKG